MHHTIEFRRAVELDVHISAKKPLERASVRKGTRVKAQIKPYVADIGRGLIEMADLFFEDGSSTTGIPFAWFRFVED